jgi:ATP-dependent Zn protease
VIAAVARAVVAHHEAGHAAINLWFQQTVDRVSIVPEEEVAGHAEIDRGGDEALRYGDDEFKRQVTFERRIMAAMAGEVAQRRFAPRSVRRQHGATDRIMVADYLDELECPTEKIRVAYERLLRLRTEALINRLWDSVERIAALLLERGTITGEEAREAFADPNLRL